MEGSSSCEDCLLGGGRSLGGGAPSTWPAGASGSRASALEKPRVLRKLASSGSASCCSASGLTVLLAARRIRAHPPRARRQDALAPAATYGAPCAFPGGTAPALRLLPALIRRHCVQTGKPGAGAGWAFAQVPGERDALRRLSRSSRRGRGALPGCLADPLGCQDGHLPQGAPAWGPLLLLLVLSFLFRICVGKK